MNNITKVLIAATMLFLIIGTVNASDISTDTASHDSIESGHDTDNINVMGNEMIKSDKLYNENNKNAKEAQNSKKIYVNQETGDDINGLGTIDKPFESLNAGIYNAEDDDEIIITSELCLIKSWREVPNEIYKNITISSPLKDKTTIYCGSLEDYKRGISFGSFNDIFNVSKGHNIKLYNINFYKCNARTIINNYGTVIIDNCNFINCSDGYGDTESAIIVNHNNMNISNSNFKNGFGVHGCHGTIFNKGILNISNTNFTNNTDDNNGGAIFNNGVLEINNSNFINNDIYQYSNTSEGGAIYNKKILLLKNTYFEGNYAINGSQIANYGNVTIDKCEFKNTRSSSSLIYNNKMKTPTQANISNSLLKNLTSADYIWNNATLNIQNCTIENLHSGNSLIINYNILNLTRNKIIDCYDISNIIDNKGKITVTNNLFKNTLYGFSVININGNDKSLISNNIFESHKGLDSPIYIQKNKETIINYNTFINNQNTYNDKGGAIYSNSSNVEISYNKFIKNVANTGSAIYNIGNKNKIRYNNFTANTATTKGYNVNNKGTNVTARGNINYYGTKYPSTIENNGNNVEIIGNRFEDTLKTISTTTTVQTLNGVVCERLTLKATVKDNVGTPIDGGRVIFKLNGITLKDNGKLSGSNNPLKVYVSNGEAVTNIIADLSMKSVTKFTASFIGTSIYNKSNSNTAKAEIKLRSARISVSSNVKTIKQGQVLTLKVQVYDTTNGKLVNHKDEFIYFKVNGITLKDSNGNMLKAKIVNGIATVNYTIPLGLSGVTDGKSMTPKNHTILAGFYNKNYHENIRNTSYFQVERSNITITISNATVNNKTHKLSLKATIKDYLGNIVKGPNKCVIKINGVSLKNGTQPIYYYSTNGLLNIKNINIPTYNKYTSIEIVTQDRLAYKSQRNSTTTIKVTN